MGKKNKEEIVVSRKIKIKMRDRQILLDSRMVTRTVGVMGLLIVIMKLCQGPKRDWAKVLQLRKEVPVILVLREQGKDVDLMIHLMKGTMLILD